MRTCERTHVLAGECTHWKGCSQATCPDLFAILRVVLSIAVFLSLFGALNVFSFLTRASPVAAQAEYYRGIPLIFSTVVVLHYLVEAFWFSAVDRLVAMLLVLLVCFGVAVNRVDINISNRSINFAWARSERMIRKDR
jgi:hypothetical protein